MKHFRLVALATLVWFFPTGAFAQIETPRPSPKGKVEQKVGVMDVSITYSRPGIKGRKIFGGLVPYGEVWRTGANEPTTISVSDPVKLEGHDVPAGTYSLYTIPEVDEWTIIINKTLTGPPRDDKEDVVSFKVKPLKLMETVETFTINVSDITTNAASVELAWEHTAVKFRMEFDVDAKVVSAIQKFVENPYSNIAGTYYNAASYYFETGKDLKLALEWVNKSLELNAKPYWVWRLKSQVQAALRDFRGAIVSAQESKARAKDAGNNQFVDINDEAIREWSRMK